MSVIWHCWHDKGLQNNVAAMFELCMYQSTQLCSCLLHELHVTETGPIVDLVGNESQKLHSHTQTLFSLQGDMIQKTTLQQVVSCLQDLAQGGMLPRFFSQF